MYGKQIVRGKINIIITKLFTSHMHDIIIRQIGRSYDQIICAWRTWMWCASVVHHCVNIIQCMWDVTADDSEEAEMLRMHTRYTFTWLGRHSAGCTLPHAQPPLFALRNNKAVSGYRPGPGTRTHNKIQRGEGQEILFDSQTLWVHRDSVIWLERPRNNTLHGHASGKTATHLNVYTCIHVLHIGKLLNSAADGKSLARKLFLTLLCWKCERGIKIKT